MTPEERLNAALSQELQDIQKQHVSILDEQIARRDIYIERLEADRAKLISALREILEECETWEHYDSRLGDIAVIARRALPDTE